MTADDSDFVPVSRRRLLHGVGVAGSAALLAGCTDGGTEDPTETDTTEEGTDDGTDDETTQTTTQEQLPDGKLTIGQSKAPIEFDPIVVNDVPSIQVLRRVFDPLYTFGEGFDPVPKIAASEPEVERDGQRYTVPLKDGPTFHSGDPVTAEDVKYSFEAPVDEETPNMGQVDMIDSITVVDDSTVQFDLKYPDPKFRNGLVWEIVPKSVREEDKDAFNTEQPIGAGPFEFAEWSQGDNVVLERWDDYWDDPAHLSEVEYVPVEEPTTRVTTLQSGEVDMFKEVPPELWEQVQSMDGAEIQWKTGVNYYYAGYNCKEGPTTDLQVREAIDYAVDLDQAVQNFIEPAGSRTYTPVPSTLAEEWDFPVDEWAGIPHDKDVDRTKELLDDSDAVDDGYEFTIIVPPDDKRESIGISMGNGLEEAGYESTVQRLDWGTYLTKYNTGDPDDYNVFVLGSGGGADPDDVLYWLFTHEQFGNANGCFYENEEMDEALMTARQITDRERRRELYIEAVNILLENRAHLPVYELRESWGVGDVVQNFTVHPYGQWNPRLSAPYQQVSVDK